MTKQEQFPEEEVYEEDILELVDEDGNVDKFCVLATLEYKGSLYGVFQAAEPEEGEENACYIFSLEEDGEEMIANEVEDEELADAVFQSYLEQYESYEEEEE